MDITCTGTDPARLAAIFERGLDDAGARVEPFADDEGGWPLRCCLRDSARGDRLAIIGYSPFDWVGPYRETGPLVVHTTGCPGHTRAYPEQFERRDQVLRAFGDDAGRHNTQVYALNRLVHAGEGLRVAVEEVLTDPRVREVHSHNVISQCFNFAATPTAPSSTTP